MKFFRLFITFTLICFAFLSKAKAIVPAPDGGYPGFTTAEGANALQNLTTGVGNTATGWHSLFANSAGNLNTAVGAGTLLFNAADANTAAGAAALLNNTFGHHNTAVGISALLSNTTGNYNIALGWNAGKDVDGSANIMIGHPGYSGESNTIRIGDFSYTKAYLPAIVNDPISQGGNPVYINPGTGELFLLLSSCRFKRDIQPMEKSSESIFALKPVTFHYKSDKTNTLQFGLIAEEVANVNPELVLPDKEGKPMSVRYEQVNAMLLNEFLKEHRKVQELEACAAQQQKNFAEQQKQIELLTAGLQKVSAQLEVSKAAPQTVLNNQ